jgi:DNA-binding NtrC family response regulator
VIDLFQLSDSDHSRKWAEGLSGVRLFDKDRSEQAAWTGRPFILAGDSTSLNNWFDNLEPVSRALIRDHAYFWILTSRARFDHDLLPKDRPAVLGWERHEQNVIQDAIDILGRIPRLAGLSTEMHHLREEIVRIGTGACEPASPVLILGESGSGKEGTAQSLFDVSSRPKDPGLYCIGGSWFDMDPGMALSELFGIEPKIATHVDARPGLVESYSRGAIFVDDFDTAPKLLQESLLRLTSTKKGERARYRRVGGSVDRFTDAWLVFATNHDVTEMLKRGALRPDFFFRFEDRVLVVPPLRQRPADVPAIAHSIWARLKEAAGTTLEDRILPWRCLRELHSCDRLRWNGNVRELSTLLSLVASMCGMPQHRHKSTGTLISQVLAKGDSSFEWLGIIAERESSHPPPTFGPVEEILAAEESASQVGLSGCEIFIMQKLGDKRWAELKSLVGDKTGIRDRDRVRQKICRYLVFATRHKRLTTKEATALGQIQSTWALKQLKWLAQSRKFLKETAESDPPLKYIFGPGDYLSES